MNEIMFISILLAVVCGVTTLLKARLQGKIVNGEVIELGGKFYVAKEISNPHF